MQASSLFEVDGSSVGRQDGFAASDYCMFDGVAAQRYSCEPLMCIVHALILQTEATIVLCSSGQVAGRSRCKRSCPFRDSQLQC